MSQRKIIIGAVRGSYDELCALLKKAEFDEAKDKLIFAGDLMDGEKSWEVFQLVRRLKSEMGSRLVIVRGDHEQLFIDRDEFWDMAGGTKTRESFCSHRDNVMNYRVWLLTHTDLYYRDPEDDFQVVHSGLYNPDPSKEDANVLLWDRDALKKGMYDGKLTFCAAAAARHPLLAFKGTDGPHRIRAEYDITYDIAPSLGLLCIDQGCVLGGGLTAAIVQNRQVRLIHVENMRKRS